VAGLPQSVEMLVTLHDSTFSADSPLQLTCTEGLSLSAETLSDDGRLTLTDADSNKHELRVILSAFATLTDSCDSSLCHEVMLLGSLAMLILFISKIDLSALRSAIG